ncbi:BrnT family toxin [Oxalobacteraceae bacterium CAVE-383]|nr:BrnT family toxin [Oxalobacteraceae bacterium CAVE-383]
MNLTFDPKKNVANIAKHDVSLADAAEIEWDTMYAVPDVRHGGKSLCPSLKSEPSGQQWKKIKRSPRLL